MTVARSRSGRILGILFWAKSVKYDKAKINSKKVFFMMEVEY